MVHRVALALVAKLRDGTLKIPIAISLEFAEMLRLVAAVLAIPDGRAEAHAAQQRPVKLAVERRVRAVQLQRVAVRAERSQVAALLALGEVVRTLASLRPATCDFAARSCDVLAKVRLLLLQDCVAHVRKILRALEALARTCLTAHVVAYEFPV